jgi:hypothetical protein
MRARDLAENAAAALAYAARARLTGSAQDAMWAAVQCYEAADTLAQDQLKLGRVFGDVEELIRTSEIVRKEIADQDEVLRQLESRGPRTTLP